MTSQSSVTRLSLSSSYRSVETISVKLRLHSVETYNKFFQHYFKPPDPSWTTWSKAQRFSRAGLKYQTHCWADNVIIYPPTYIAKAIFVYLKKT